MKKLKTRIKSLEKNERRLAAGGLLFALLFISALFVTALQTSEIQYNLDSSVELKHIEDNPLGNAIIYTNSDLPVLIDEPELEACVYSSKNRSPTILPVETTNLLFSNSNLEAIDLNLTIPQDKLDRNYPESEVNLTMADRCPLRSNSEIVIREK
jgi:hypothetical protein